MMTLIPLCLIGLSWTLLAQSDAPPSALEQEQILQRMREYAAKPGPDIAYYAEFRAFESRPGSGKWREVHSFATERVAYEGRELSRIIEEPKRKGKARPPAKWREAWNFIPPPFPWDAVPATVVWDRWEVDGASLLAVFNYSVSQMDSHWFAFANTDWEHLTSLEQIKDSTIVAYSGSLSVDAATGAIWRCSDAATEIPVRFRSTYASGVTQYGQFTIGGTEYLLPVTRIDDIGLATKIVRWTRTYSNYRAFGADSVITFFGADSSIIFH